MAGTTPENTKPELQERAGRVDDAFRDDLDYAFGIVLNPPLHGPDSHGNTVYGIQPPYGASDESVSAQFADEMRDLIVAAAHPLLDRGLVSGEAIDELEARPYAFPPAAQGWPLYLFNLWQDARPFLDDGALLLTWGAAIRAILLRVRGWVRARQTEVNWEVIPAGAQSAIEVTPILTQPAIIALCYLDLTERYGINGLVSLEAHGRGYAGFTGPGHPGANDQYLIRIQTDNDTTYFWLVKGDGTVLDHYMMVGKDIAVLPLPNFSAEEPDTFRVAQPVYRATVDR